MRMGRAGVKAGVGDEKPGPEAGGGLVPPAVLLGGSSSYMLPFGAAVRGASRLCHS